MWSEAVAYSAYQKIKKIYELLHCPDNSQKFVIANKNT